MASERDFLFGVLAVRLGRLTPDRLADVASTWVDSSDRDLGELLVDDGALHDRDRSFVAGMVDQAVALSGTEGTALIELGGASTVAEAFADSITMNASGQPDFSVAATRAVATRAVADEGMVDIADIKAVAEAADRYTRTRVHDRGGMGRILVVHDEHLGRDIALKELLDAGPLGSETDSTPSGETPPRSARFLREARVTGQLEHPSIVPVYELGYRADGTLYYTMKLLRGRTLARALGAAPSRAAKLGLLPHVVDLCQAVAYAHSRGVIHRDIKPANVMIGEFGETVVIDWGLAKVRGHDDIHVHRLEKIVRPPDVGDETAAAQTLAGQAMGTPLYMPPEQARGDIANIDERSDVYSLGSVLYELLTGRPPFAGGTGLEVLERVISEDPTPVTELEPDTPPELAAICTRAMAKNPAERYQSARELAHEVERFLSGSVVEAYNYSFAEHLRRFVGRHKAQVLTVTVFLVALAVVLSSAAAWNMRERRRAEREAAKATRVSEFLVTVFQESDPYLTYGDEVTARELLDRGAAQIADELTEDPLIQAEIMSTIGWAYLGLGVLDSAEIHLKRSLEIREIHLPPDHIDLGGSYVDMAALRLDQGRAEEAEGLCRRGLEIFSATLSSEHKAVANARDQLASILTELGHYERSEALYVDVLAGQERLLGSDDPGIVTYLNNLAISLGLQGKYREAERLYRRAAAIQERAGKPNDPGLANTLNNLAITLRLQKFYDEAEPLFNRVLKIRERNFGPDHPILAGTLDDLATLYVELERLDEAEPLALRAVAIREQALAPDHPELATSFNNLANLRLVQGDLGQAEALFRRALSIWEQAWGSDHPNVGIALCNLGSVLTAAGRLDEAEADFDRGIAILEETLGADHPVLAQVMDEYAVMLRASGRDDEAVVSEQRAAEIRTE